MNKLYSVHDHWTDINKKNDVDIESIDGVITGIKVNGEDYGGGGSSDFSTAEVTVNVEGYSEGMPEYGIQNATIIVDSDELFAGLPIPLPPGLSNPISVVLYKGIAKWQINAGIDNIPITGVNGTGSVEVNEIRGDYAISITGDCSITVNYGTE